MSKVLSTVLVLLIPAFVFATSEVQIQTWHLVGTPVFVKNLPAEKASGTISPPEFALCRALHAMPSASCSARRGISLSRVPTRQPRREPDGTEIRHDRN